MPLNLCLYSSAHGYGHTTRLLAVAQAVLALEPGARIVLNTNAPEWLVQVHTGDRVEVRQRTLDIGLVQSDSFTTDQTATLERLAALQQAAPCLIAGEADWLRHERMSFVLADIPPLAGLLRQASGLPVWGMSNFGWDYLYGSMGEAFGQWVPWVRGLYGQYDGLFRLSFAEPMAAFQPILPVGLVANPSRYSRPQMRSELDIPPEQPTALLTFGGLGLADFPRDRVAERPDWLFLVTAPDAPPLPNLRSLPSGRWRLIELLGAVDLAIIKPGYSTVAECCTLGIPTVCLTRPGFIEADLLIEAVSTYLPHRILTTGALFNQPWDFLDTLMVWSAPLAAEGAQRVAEHILALSI